MHKVLLILGIVFTVLGLVIGTLAATLVLMLREPLLGLVAVPGIIFFVRPRLLAAVSPRVAGTVPGWRKTAGPSRRISSASSTTPGSG